MAAVRFSKNVVFVVHCDFVKGSQNQHFQSTPLVVREAVAKKSALTTLLIMLLTITTIILNHRSVSVDVEIITRFFVENLLL